MLGCVRVVWDGMVCYVKIWCLDGDRALDGPPTFRVSVAQFLLAFVLKVHELKLNLISYLFLYMSNGRTVLCPTVQ